MPFSLVRSPQLLDESKHWFVFRNRVCGERPLKYFAKSKLSSPFPQDIVKVKRSPLRIQNGALYDNKSSSDDKIMASSFGIIVIFLRHSPDSPIFKEEAFDSLQGSLNSLDLVVLCKVEASTAYDAHAHMVKTRRLESRSLKSKSPPSRRVD